MSQSSLWQIPNGSHDFAELCIALYQREIKLLAQGDFAHTEALQLKLKSLSYYIIRTAHAMIQVTTQDESPLYLDYQNASWSAKQNKNIPLLGQEDIAEQNVISAWYLSGAIELGLVVPIQIEQGIILDCIDRLDFENQRLRTNTSGWFHLTPQKKSEMKGDKRLLKPNKKVMLAACTGHRWQDNNKLMPILPSLRELLLSCRINWQNFKKPSRF